MSIINKLYPFNNNLVLRSLHNFTYEQFIAGFRTLRAKYFITDTDEDFKEHTQNYNQMMPSPREPKQKARHTWNPVNYLLFGINAAKYTAYYAIDKLDKPEPGPSYESKQRHYSSAGAVILKSAIEGVASFPLGALETTRYASNAAINVLNKTFSKIRSLFSGFQRGVETSIQNEKPQYSKSTGFEIKRFDRDPKQFKKQPRQRVVTDMFKVPTHVVKGEQPEQQYENENKLTM